MTKDASIVRLSSGKIGQYDQYRKQEKVHGLSDDSNVGYQFDIANILEKKVSRQHRNLLQLLL